MGEHLTGSVPRTNREVPREMAAKERAKLRGGRHHEGRRDQPLDGQKRTKVSRD